MAVLLTKVEKLPEVRKKLVLRLIDDLIRANSYRLPSVDNGVHSYIHCTVGYEWDPQKAAANLRKHKVDFADAAGAFEDPLAVTVPDDRHEEARFVTMGTDFLGRLPVVAYAWRDQNIRLISAREALPSERRQYEG